MPFRILDNKGDSIGCAKQLIIADERTADRPPSLIMRLRSKADHHMFDALGVLCEGAFTPSRADIERIIRVEEDDLEVWHMDFTRASTVVSTDREVFDILEDLGFSMTGPHFSGFAGFHSCRRIFPYIARDDSAFVDDGTDDVGEGERDSEAYDESGAVEMRGEVDE